MSEDNTKISMWMLCGKTCEGLINAGIAINISVHLQYKNNLLIFTREN